MREKGGMPRMISSESNRMPHMAARYPAKIGGLSGQICRLVTNMQMFLMENKQKMCEVIWLIQIRKKLRIQVRPFVLAKKISNYV